MHTRGFYGLLLISFLIFPEYDGSATLKIKLESYQVNGYDEGGKKCDNIFSTACDPEFTFCLDKWSGNDDMASCSYGRYKTGHYQGQNIVNFKVDGLLAGDTVYNPLMNVIEVYQGFKLKVEIYDDDSGHSGDDLIDHIYFVDRTVPSPSSAHATWLGKIVDGTRTKTEKTRLQFSILVFCNDDYYGPSCTVHCVATDSDIHGHYTCDPITGDIICKPGWQSPSENCIVKADDCESNPCHNGAMCVDHYKYYTCDCLPGYTGYNCDIDIDECESNPCLNGGTCIEGTDIFTCQCTDLYTGHSCQHHICDVTDFCLNGGTCFDDGGNVSCICPKQYTGRHCDVDKCDVIGCQNGGTCSNGTCYCPSPYIGSVCDVDLCEHLQCTHGGSCLAGVCMCKEGYTGKYCHVNINECESNPCLNEATCKDQLNGYICRCLPEYNGTHCEDKLPVTWNISEKEKQSFAFVDPHQSTVPRWVAGVITAIVVCIIICIIVFVTLLKYRRRAKEAYENEEVIVHTGGLDHFNNPLYNEGGDIPAVASNVPMSDTKEIPPDYLEDLAAPPPYTLHAECDPNLVDHDPGELVKEPVPTENVVQVALDNDNSELYGAVGGQLPIDHENLGQNPPMDYLDGNENHLYDTPKSIRTIGGSSTGLPPEDWTPVKQPHLTGNISGIKDNAGYCDDEGLSIQSNGTVSFSATKENCDIMGNKEEENPYSDVDFSIHNNDTNEKLEEQENDQVTGYSI